MTNGFSGSYTMWKQPCNCIYKLVVPFCQFSIRSFSGEGWWAGVVGWGGGVAWRGCCGLSSGGGLGWYGFCGFFYFTELKGLGTLSHLVSLPLCTNVQSHITLIFPSLIGDIYSWHCKNLNTWYFSESIINILTLQSNLKIAYTMTRFYLG